MKYLLIVVIFLNTVQLFSQELLMKKKVQVEEGRLTKGSNMKKFGYLYFSYGQQVPGVLSDEPAMKPFNSHYYQLGYRYKYKLREYYAVGYDLSFSRKSYALLQKTSKTFPNDLLHDKEKLVFNHFGLEIYNRFNFKKRGNHMGLFLDAGGFINLAARVKHTYMDELEDPDIDFGRTKVTNTRLDYTNDLELGLRVRLGYRRIAVFADYSLTGLIKDDFNYPSLTPLSIGLQLGLYFN